jgi:hypothetical protein
MQKTSFQATDATTQSSNQEENKRKKKKKIISLQNTQKGKNMTRSKPRELKEHSGLNANCK